MNTWNPCNYIIYEQKLCENLNLLNYKLIPSLFKVRRAQLAYPYFFIKALMTLKVLNLFLNFDAEFSMRIKVLYKYILKKNVEYMQF